MYELLLLDFIQPETKEMIRRGVPSMTRITGAMNRWLKMEEKSEIYSLLNYIFEDEMNK